MKYRIKIITFKNGRKLFLPYVKTKIGWLPLNSDGKIDLAEAIPGIGGFKSRERVLDIIDKHFEGNNTIQSIDFEFITK